MYRVEFRFQGAGLWNTGGLPMTELGAAYKANVLRDLGFADEARVVPSQPIAEHDGPRAVDLKV